MLFTCEHSFFSWNTLSQFEIINSHTEKALLSRLDRLSSQVDIFSTRAQFIHFGTYRLRFLHTFTSTKSPKSHIFSNRDMSLLQALLCLLRDIIQALTNTSVFTKTILFPQGKHLGSTYYNCRNTFLCRDIVFISGRIFFRKGYFLPTRKMLRSLGAYLFHNLTYFLHKRTYFTDTKAYFQHQVHALLTLAYKFVTCDIRSFNESVRAFITSTSCFHNVQIIFS